MEEKTSISIGLHIDNQTIDLQIPIEVTINRLKDLLRESLIIVNIVLPELFEIEVMNKPIKLNENAVLSDYPLGNGDQLAIKKITELEE